MIMISTKTRLLAKLAELKKSTDTESAHYQADEILLEILREEGGYDEIIEAYENIHKWFA